MASVEIKSPAAAPDGHVGVAGESGAGPNTLRRILAERGFRGRLASAVGFSVAINLLLLVSPLYMLQVYDRVLTSGSYETLTLLSIIAVFLLAIYAAADGGRKRAFSLLAAMLSQRLEKDLYRRELTTSGRVSDNASLALGKLQSFLMNGGPAPLFDLPFAPLFFVLLFLVHPLLGSIGLVGALLLIGIAVAAELITKEPTQRAAQQENQSTALLRRSLAASEAVTGLGMVGAITDRVTGARRAGLRTSLSAGNAGAYLASLSRSLRQILQVLALGAGAYLVLQQEISPGAIIAGSIIMGRGLAPIDQIVGQWKQLTRIRSDLAKVTGAMPEMSPSNEKPALPRPAPRLRFENFAVATPRGETVLIPKFNLTVASGDLVAVTGNSGAGKSTLLKAAIGVVPPMEGTVRLGEVNLHGWDADDRGRYLGYMPQETPLFAGTIRENIARFHDVSDEDVFEAVKKAGAEHIVASLPGSYAMRVGAEQAGLSGGQRQAIGLARALLGDPILLALDEPTASLDTQMVGNVVRALTAHAADGGIGLVATHDVRVINACNWVMSLRNGAVSMQPKQAFFDELRKGAAVAG